jgi:chromosome segregation protein
MAHLTARREEAEAATRLVTEARTEQATLSERVAGLQTEIVRLEEGADELEARIAVRQEEMQRAEARRLELRQTITETAALLDDVVRDLEGLRHQVREADESVVSCREDFGVHEHQIRGARHALEAIRSEVTQYEVARATAAADLAHLASTCFEAVSASIEDVVLEVARMEHEGELAASGKRLAAISAPDEDEGGEGAEAEPRPTWMDAADAAASSDSLRGGLPAEAASDASDPRRLEPRNLGTSEPEEIISDLRHKIDRLGPVNMMAIEQFDDLETRHTFLTSQRKDLLDSIGQTNEAIRKIDKTTRERFEEAFSSINTNFAGTFTTLFGGGRAGLVLIDQDNDPESGIDIIAQPPGKRLQNVQLLSGGEKALTAMALMFAIFKYRPSPFCLLDEIDAPLDDANIGRFVDMLRGMQAHTQFILITHNRKTMEIANRLYGVTMEEPGVSKLISLQLN